MKIERLVTIWVKNGAKSERFKRFVNGSFRERMRRGEGGERHEDE